MKLKYLIWIFVFLMSLFSVNAVLSGYSNIVYQQFTDTGNNCANWSITGTKFLCDSAGIYIEKTGAGGADYVHFINMLPNLSINTNNITVRFSLNYSAGVQNGAAVIFQTDNASGTGASDKFMLSQTAVGGNSYNVYHSASAANLSTMPDYGGHFQNITFRFYLNYTAETYINETQSGYFSLDQFTGTRQPNITFFSLGDAGGDTRTKTFGFKNFLVWNGTNLTASASDTTAPIINGTLNATKLNGETYQVRLTDFINFTFNWTDETAGSYGNITLNTSRCGTFKTNFSGLSGTSGQFSNTTNIRYCFRGNDYVNVTGFMTDSSGNKKQNTTIFNITDNIFPLTNGSLNLTNPRISDIINISVNSTDESGLLSVNFTINFSATEGGIKYFNYTFTDSRTIANISNSTQFNGTGLSSVYNITFYSTDIGNNVNQTSIKITLVDNIFPIINASLDDSTPFFKSIVNMTANVTDETALSFCQFIDNQSLVGGGKNFFNKSVTGTSDQCSQNYTIALDARNVINFTVIVNDTSNNKVQVTQITEVNSTNLLGCEDLDVPNTRYNLTANVSSAGTCMYIMANNITLDCYGFKINYSQSIVGFAINDTAGFNYSTIRSCNIVQGNPANPSTRSYAILLNSSSNNTIFNNTITTYGNNAWGIVVASYSNNNSIYGNNYTSNGFDGIGVRLTQNASYNSIHNNIINTITSYGIYLITSTFNNSIYSNIINVGGSQEIGVIILDNAYSNSIFNNNITSLDGLGISLGSSPGAGLTGLNVFNNSIYANNITTNGSLGYGIYITGNAYNNTFYSNTIMANNSHGIFLNNNTYNNIFFNNTITTKNATNSFGIYILNNGNNNTFYNNIITSLSAGIVINGSGQLFGQTTRFNTFTNDTIVPCVAGCASNYNDIVLTANATDIIFTNVTLNNSRIAMNPNSPLLPNEINNLTIKWFLDINVTNATDNNPIVNAQVVINDSFNLNIFNGTTNAVGGIPTQLVTGFTMNGSVPFNVNTDTCTNLKANINITCFSPYNISVNFTGYTPLSVSIDINKSKFLNLSMSLPIIQSSPAPSGSSGGGGGGGGGYAPTKCNSYVQAYNQCYYYDADMQSCNVGCQNGYECQSLQCVQITNTTTHTTILNIPEQLQEMSLWEKIKLWFASLFSSEAPLEAVPIKNPINDITSPTIANINPINPNPLIATKTLINENKPAFALILTGLVILGFALYTFGFGIFTNALALLIMGLSLLIGYLLINYHIFG